MRNYILGVALQKSVERLVDNIVARGEREGDVVSFDAFYEGEIPGEINRWREEEEHLMPTGHPRKYGDVEAMVHAELVRRGLTIRQEIW